MTGVYFRGKLQHGGDVSQQKIKCRPIKTQEIVGVIIASRWHHHEVVIVFYYSAQKIFLTVLPLHSEFYIFSFVPHCTKYYIQDSIMPPPLNSKNNYFIKKRKRKKKSKIFFFFIYLNFCLVRGLRTIYRKNFHETEKTQWFLGSFYKKKYRKYFVAKNLNKKVLTSATFGHFLYLFYTFRNVHKKILEETFVSNFSSNECP